MDPENKPPHIRSLFDQLMNTLGEAYKDPEHVHFPSLLAAESIARELKSHGIKFEYVVGINFSKDKKTEQKKKGASKNKDSASCQNMTHLLFEFNRALFAYMSPDMIDDVIKNAAKEDAAVRAAIDKIQCAEKRIIDSWHGFLWIISPASEEMAQWTESEKTKRLMKEMGIRPGTSGT